MYINDQKKSVAVFLNQVHADMINKYVKGSLLGNVGQMEQNAKDLQSFFYNLKNNTVLDNNLSWLLMKQQILEDVKSLSGNQNIKLFQTTGGKSFEQQLSQVMYSIFSQVSGKEVSQEGYQQLNIHIGQSAVGVKNLEQDILNPIVQNALEGFGVKTQKRLEKDGLRTKAYYLQNVQQKTDVQGQKVIINGAPSAELLRIYNLLKDATFTAKNYLDIFNNSFYSKSLKLGSSNIFRSFYSVLSDLNYPMPTIISALQSSYYTWEKRPIIALRLNQIKFVYELIGAGQIAKLPKYLIYNVPNSGQIYVESTAKIIQDFLMSDRAGYQNPFGSSTKLSKGYFKK